MSNFGTYPTWSPYKGEAIQKAITYGQTNTLDDNTYRGPGRFMPFEQGSLETFAEWRAAAYRQDAGS